IRGLRGHTQPVTRVVVSEKKYLVSGSSDGEQPGEIKVWSAETGVEKLTLGAGQAHGESVSLSPDGRCLAAGVGPQAVKVWDAETGREAPPLLAPGWQGHVFAVCRTAFSRDGKGLVSGCTNGYVRVWDLPGGQVRPAGAGNFPRLLQLQATADGRHLVFAA